MIKLLKYVPVFLLIAAALQAEDRFDLLKKELSEGACARFEFLSIIESDIFDRVDTSNGVAVIARDGRYFISIGDDEYLYDAIYLYTYSRLNNQITVEKMFDYQGEELFFITRLDKYFKTSVLQKNKEFSLVRRDSELDNIPDSMRVIIDPAGPALKEIIYFDINEEQNRLIFTRQDIKPVCDDHIFVPEFPDTAEIIKMY
ncbi:MAG: LolA family protein [Candidatus Zixiibacteriota bacterium]